MPVSWVPARPLSARFSRGSSRGISSIWMNASSNPPGWLSLRFSNASANQSFRQIEADQLRAALGRASELKEATVLALGGGTYAQPGCPEFLRNAGVPVLWLDSPIELLLSRCMTMTGRPLFRDEVQLSRASCAAASLVSTGGSSCGQLRRSHSSRCGNPRPWHCAGRWQRSTSRRRKTKFLTCLR